MFSANIAADFRANSYSPSLLGFLRGWFFSPALRLLILFRLARYLQNERIPLIPKVLWRWSVSSSGCYFSLEAEIGGGICLPHPTGIVIGEGVVIGTGATVYQNVTMGRAQVDEPSYPVLGDQVVVYPGAVLIGPINVGTRAIIAANAVVRQDVPARSLAVGVPARIITRE
ncbi:serine O-acetyltransferase [Caulobacter sp. BP25]|uniref:serine O-acetyltransferase n=1 Tax=Caulobacter sp. BP25 TaxID=2048900 RepID=UPI000C12E025|nr:hypothetical protein [Caulobacter sp. BP25]PHY22895.1 hypothetical protein CSW59_00470 [Caulobacter sp. BP25]